MSNLRLYLDLSRTKRKHSHLKIGEYGIHHDLKVNSGEQKVSVDIQQGNDQKTSDSVDVQIPGIAKFVMKGQYGVTIAAMTILAIFVVERMYTLSLCLVKCQNGRQILQERLVSYF